MCLVFIKLFISTSCLLQMSQSTEHQSTVSSLRIFGVSDLHSEFYSKYEAAEAVESVILKIKQNRETLPDADVLVLAGDIGDPFNQRDTYAALLKEFKKTYQHVVLVAGNHEHYKTKNFDLSLTHRAIKEMCDESGVIFLEKDSVIIQRVKFIGTTLWSEANAHAFFSINDHGRVFNDVSQYNQEFKNCFTWLRDELSKSSDSDLYDDCVVVTHHLPSHELCHERFKNYDSLNTAFYTNILDELNVKNVRYWFCGHTHEAMVKTLQGKDGEVTIVVNPLGYPREIKDTDVSTSVYQINKH